MKKLAILVLISVLPLYCLKGQDKNFPEISKELYDKANVAQNLDYLSPEEKRVVYLTNLARLDGGLFAKTYLAKYIQDNNLDQSNEAITSLITELKNTKLDALMIPTPKLSEVAKYHAEDSGKNGYVGHDSTDGTSFAKRLRNHGIKGAIAENCSYGYDKAEGIMMQLLIDQNVPSRGHRKNILNPSYKFIGVAIHAHTKWSFTCVQDFSTSKE